MYTLTHVVVWGVEEDGSVGEDGWQLLEAEVGAHHTRSKPERGVILDGKTEIYGDRKRKGKGDTDGERDTDKESDRQRERQIERRR